MTGNEQAELDAERAEQEKLDELEGRIFKEMHMGFAEVHRQIAEQQNTTTTVTRTVAVNADSVTVGSPTNGQIKVYGDFDDPEKFARKINTAIELLREAKEQHNIVNGAK